MSASSDDQPDFAVIDTAAIPVVSEINLEALFGFRIVERDSDMLRVNVTLTKKALAYLCCFSSDANARFHIEKGLVQGSLWMWLTQLAVSRWQPLHGPVEFAGKLPCPSFVIGEEQARFSMLIKREGKRGMRVGVYGPYSGGEPSEVFHFTCQLFPMQLALRAQPR